MRIDRRPDGTYPDHRQVGDLWLCSSPLRQYLVIPSDTKDTMQCLHVKRLDPVTVYFAHCPRRSYKVSKSEGTRKVEYVYHF